MTSLSADAIRAKMLTSIDESVYAIATAERRFLHQADECIAGFLGLPLERRPLTFVETHIQRSEPHPSGSDHLVDLFEGKHAGALGAKPDAIGEIAIAPAERSRRFRQLMVFRGNLRQSGGFFADHPEIVADPALRRTVALPSIDNLARSFDPGCCGFEVHDTISAVPSGKRSTAYVRATSGRRSNAQIFVFINQRVDGGPKTERRLNQHKVQGIGIQLRSASRRPAAARIRLRLQALEGHPIVLKDRRELSLGHFHGAYCAQKTLKQQITPICQMRLCSSRFFATRKTSIGEKARIS